MNVRHISGGYNMRAFTEFSGVINRLILSASQTVVSHCLIQADPLMPCLYRCDQCGQCPRNPETAKFSSYLMSLIVLKYFSEGANIL